MKKPQELTLEDWRKALTQNHTYVFITKTHLYVIAAVRTNIKLSTQVEMVQVVEQLCWRAMANKLKKDGQGYTAKCLGEGFVAPEQAYQTIYLHAFRNQPNNTEKKLGITREENRQLETLELLIGATQQMVETSERMIATVGVLHDNFFREQQRAYSDQLARLKGQLLEFQNQLIGKYPPLQTVFK